MNRRTTMSEVKTMTVFEALQEVKLLKQKISKVRNEMLPLFFVPAVKGKDVDIEGHDKERIKASVQAWWDKYQSYENRLNLLSGLIYESNLKTPMEVAGRKYTSIAAAITRYKTIDSEIKLYSDLLKEYKRVAASVINANNRNLGQENILRAVNPTDIQYEPEQLESLKSSYIAATEQEVYDPLGLAENDRLVNLVDETAEFRERFHTELNKLNLTTVLEVPVDEPKL